MPKEETKEEKRIRLNAYRKEWYRKKLEIDAEKVREEHRIYQRNWYKENAEKQRKKNVEKYHKNKDRLKANRSEEEKKRIRELRNVHQKIHYWKVRGIILDPNELKKGNISAKKIREIDSMKKVRLPSRINTKYVTEVLKNFPNHRLWDLLVTKWVLADLLEFEELENKLNKK